MTQITKQEYLDLLHDRTEHAIEWLDSEVDHDLDTDTLQRVAPEYARKAVEFAEFDEHSEEPGFDGLMWADPDGSSVFYGSVIEVDAELFNQTGRDNRCMREAWRTDWRWFANMDRWNHTKDASPEGPIMTTDDRTEMENSPARTLQSSAYGLLMARVHERMARHYGRQIEQAKLGDN